MHLPESSGNAPSLRKAHFYERGNYDTQGGMSVAVTAKVYYHIAHYGKSVVKGNRLDSSIL